jgi:cation diffusion facilitator CzcD-associated flavoprotein CzcO
VTEAGEELVADAVVAAMGMFNELAWPDIPGLDRFAGTIFHSARWDHGHDLTGERVAVIGSAASAVQFVPQIALQAGQLHVFQRTANWVMPKNDEPFSDAELEAFRNDPMAARQKRWELWRNLEKFITFNDPELLRGAEAAALERLAAVEDPEVRAKLTPNHPVGCKRPLISDNFYPTFNRANVELVTEPISRVTADAVVTADGTERPVDTIVVATGFATTKYLAAIEVTGRNGQRLDEAWEKGAQAYLGLTTAGFPNLFMLYGPNTNNGSIIFMLECQAAYAVRHIRWLAEDDLAWIDIKPEVMERYNDELQRDLAAVEVWQASCSNYYHGPDGRIVTQWPHTMAEYRARTSQFDPELYDTGVGRVGVAR